VLAIVSEMAGVMGIAYGAGRRYEGPMGKSDRAFVFSVLGLAIGFGLPIEALLDWAWMATAILIALTIVNRVRHGLQGATQ